MAIQEIIWYFFVCTVILPQSFGAERNRCLKNELYEHPTDCRKFYSCTPFGPVLMHCPAGLHFDPQYLVCDWPQNAGCTGKIFEEAENDPEKFCPIYPDPDDCTKFYLCAPSGPTLMQCPGDLHFNPQLLVCDWVQNVECINSSTGYPAAMTPATITSEHLNDFLEGISTVEISKTTESIIDTEHHADTIIPTEYTTIIPTTPEASNATSLCKNNIWPHLNDCRKFFLCGSTGVVEMVCPEGMHFSPELLICDWPYVAGCEENSMLTPETTTTTNSVDMSTTPATTTGFTEIITTEHISTTQSDVEHLETTLLTDVYTTTTENILSTDGLTETIGPLTESTPIFPSMDTQICIGNIWPNPNDCTKFFMCGSTGAVEKLCPEYMHFNPILLVCDWPVNAGCRVQTPEIITTELTTDSSNTFVPTTLSFENITISDEESTSDVEYLETTTIEDATTETTTTQNIVSTGGYTETIATEKNITNEVDSITEYTNIFQSINNTKLCEGSIWPNPEDCTKFFMCGSTGAVEKLCPGDLHFNPMLLVCDWPVNAGCIVQTPESTSTELTTDPSNTIVPTTLSFENITIISDEESTSGGEYLETTTIEDTTTETTTTQNVFSTDTDTERIATEENITNEVDPITESTDIFQSMNNTKLCEGSIWPNPEDCTKFFMCGSTGAVDKLCPEDLHFNPILLVCDWPINAGCRVYLNITPETTTTEFTTDSLNTLIPTILSFENITMSDDELTSITTTSLETSTTSESTTMFQNTEICKSSIWANPEDCAKFFTCSAAGAIENSCPEQLHFNPVLLVCDYPYKAGCKDNLNMSSEITTTDASTEFEIDFLSTTNSAITDATTANDAFETVTTERITESTMSLEYIETSVKEDTSTIENLLISTTDLDTEKLDDFIATAEGTPSNQSTDSDVLCKANIWPHPDDCKKFFMCGSTGPVELSCDENLHFNPVSLVCDWPDNAGCRSIPQLEK